MKDLTGKRFGKLVVIKRTIAPNGAREAYWECQCDCGNITNVRGTHLRQGKIVSCGCYGKGYNRKDLTGLRFGKLLVIKEVETETKGTSWLCKCDCGKDTIVKTADLLRGYTQSCGCIAFNCHGSLQEEDVRSFVQSILPNYVIDKVKILDDGSSRKKEIDIYIPALKIGIEYNGSAFHTSSGAKIGRNIPNTYHQN